MYPFATHSASSYIKYHFGRSNSGNKQPSNSDRRIILQVPVPDTEELQSQGRGELNKGTNLAQVSEGQFPAVDEHGSKKYKKGPDNPLKFKPDTGVWC